MHKGNIIKVSKTDQWGSSIARGKRLDFQLPNKVKSWQKPRAESLEPKTGTSNWDEPEWKAEE